MELKIITMKKLLLFFICLPLFVCAQTNLVPNPSFENVVNCPDNNTSFNDSSIYNTTSWRNGNQHSPDYFHSCATFSSASVPVNQFGVQAARTGNAYAGIYSFTLSGITGMREYIYVELDDEKKLQENYLYHVGFYFSASDIYKSLNRDIGIQFSTTPFNNSLDVFPYDSNYTVMDTNCIDSLNTDDWILVSGIYKAKGDEQYLTIGSFRDTISTISTMIYDTTVWWAVNYNDRHYSYCYIDDVFIIPLDSPATYNCIANACVDPQDGSGLYDSLATCQAACNATAIEENNSKKQLLKITDVLGRESKPAPNVPLFYRYDDGTVEKRIVVE
jgi:hypothetical protein